MHVNMPDELLKRLDTWRANHKLLTGRMVTRSRAICLLLDETLGDTEQVALPTFADIVSRVEALEKMARDSEV